LLELSADVIYVSSEDLNSFFGNIIFILDGGDFTDERIDFGVLL